MYAVWALKQEEAACVRTEMPFELPFRDHGRPSVKREISSGDEIANQMETLREFGPVRR